VKVPDRDEEVAAWSHSVAGQGVLLHSSPDEHWGLRVQPHGFTDHPCCVGQRAHLLHAGNAVANHCVHLHAHCQVSLGVHADGVIDSEQTHNGV